MAQYNETPVLRDVQVAQEIRNMAALGKFPKEITAYGLVYYKNGQRFYMLSTDAAKLIYFLNETENQQFFPTPIERYSERLAIPEGYEEDAVQAIKLKLARQMQADYPVSIFAQLAKVGQTLPNDSLEKPLQQYRLQLESAFSAEKIRAFLSLCTKSYLRKNISFLVYQQLAAWCAKRLLQIERHVPPSNIKEKSFYGLAIIEHGKISKCVINANLNCIYQEKLSIEQQGFMTTIWHKNTFQMEAQQSLQGIVVQMTEILKQIYDDEMLSLLQQIEQAPVVISRQQLQIQDEGKKAASLVQLYGRLWGIKNEKQREGVCNDSSLSK